MAGRQFGSTVTGEDERRLEAVAAVRDLIGGGNALEGAAVSTAVATNSTVTEVAKIAGTNASSLLVPKVYTDDDPAVGQRYGTQSIPTMAVFRGGQEVGRTSGARPASAIEQWVRQTV